MKPSAPDFQIFKISKKVLGGCLRNMEINLREMRGRERDILEEIARLRSRAEMLTRELTDDPVQSSPAGDKMAAIIEQILSLEQRLQEQRNCINEAKEILERQIRRIEKKRDRKIMRMRFLYGMSANAISRRMRCSVSSVYKTFARYKNMCPGDY